MGHDINITKNKNIVISRLLKQTDNYNNIFSDMKESSYIMLNEPSKIQHKQSHKQSHKRKKSVLEYKKLDFVL